MTFFDDHAIDAEVAALRPYVEWSGRVTAKDYGFDGLKAAQLSTITRWMNQGPGWVICRWAPRGYPGIYPEIRPRRPILKGHTWHAHPTVPSDVPPVHPETGRPIPDTHMHTAARMRLHINRTAPDGHDGVNVETVHSHPDTAKYLFPPGEQELYAWGHDHATQYKDTPRGLERLAKHLARWPHFDSIAHRYTAEQLLQLSYAELQQTVTGPHSHADKRKTRDPEKVLAQRIDVHPLALPRFASASLVYLGIEGCIKADAMLSFIRRAGWRDATVCSVPSVTLWNAPELDQFATEYLLGKRVVIVPDADWYKYAKNDGAVLNQALFLRERLRHLGVDAHIEAPPSAVFEADPGIKGVDDYLHAGGCLDELDVIHREVDQASVLAWAQQEQGRRREDGVRRDATILERLALFAGPTGSGYAPSCASLGYILYPARSADAVERAVKSLVKHGAIELSGSLATRRNHWGGQYDWTDPPTITILADIRVTGEPAPTRNTEVRTIEAA